jgi:mRNA (2'-O-methyladenosine-N6-)-methyltransferase
MSDDELKLIVSATLKALLISGKVSPPLSSFQLLTRAISCELQPTAAKVFSRSEATTPRLKLTDLSRLESILEDLSCAWESGTIVLSREGGSMTIVDLRLHSPGRCESVNPKKRKRVVDEDADSAAGDDAVEELDHVASNLAAVPLASFSHQLKEIYALLQKGTARGRLLAEQVYPCFMTGWTSGLTLQFLPLASIRL